MILFFKAEQLGLFDAPVNVRASVRRDGTVVKPHTRIQKKRAEPPKRRASGDLFADPPKPAFRPTHLLSDGTEVVAGDEPDLWIDAEGSEIEDTEAVPIGAKGREEKLRERAPSRVESDAWQRFGAGPVEGLELRHRNGGSWVLILADASEPGKYRYQIFDHDGVQAHESFPSLREALEGAWAAGYRERDIGAMDRVVQQKRLAPEPDPQFDRAMTKQAAKLRGRGEGIIARAEEDLGRDRQMNTPRRARMGHGAMQQAQKEKALGETLIRIADAMEAGSVSRLSRLSNAKQLEALDSELRRARLVGLSYSEQKAMEGKPYGPEDVAKAQFPVIQLHGHMAHSVANDLAKLTGGKALAGWLRARAGRIGRDEQFEIPFEKAAAIVKMDPKAHWYLTSRVGEIKRLAALGIENTQDLRAALAELVTLRSDAQGIDPIKKAEMALIGTKIPGYFPTPNGIVEQMIAAAGIHPGMAVLEPSAGKGDIADMIRHAGVDPDVIEINSTLRDILEAKGHRVIGHDFLELEDGERYDAIVMNPPFENFQDAEHVKRAYALLKPGGTLVSIMSPAAFFRTDRKAQAFREWMEGLDGAAVEKLPEGSFLQSDRSTGVSTRLFVVTKPERKEQAPEILHQVNNAEDGVTAKVAAMPDGRYSITLWDDDAGEAVGAAHIVPDLERAKAEAQRISGVHAGPKEGDTKVEDGVAYVLRNGRWHRQTPEPELGVEYPTENVERAYAHTSSRPSIAAALHERWFDEAVQEQIAAAQEHVRTPEQERAMAVAVDAFKRDYIDREARSLALRAVTVSSHIAGKSNFNAKQAGKRGSALDRATADFVQWLKDQSGRVRRAVLAARTDEQKAADTAAAAAAQEAKATKRTADLRRIMEKLVAFEPGQELKIAGRMVTKVTRGKDGYPVSFVVDDPEMMDNKFNITEVLFSGDRAAMRAMADAIRADAEAAPPAQAIEDAYYDQDLDGARKAPERARPATPPEPKEGDTKTENGITYVLRDGRWHRETPEEKPEPKAAQPDDLNPNSPNYRYRDTGYIPGSRKEEAAGMLRRAGREGKQVRKNDVNWNELEDNPREAEEVITKSNLFGSVDWEALKADGMEPAAGFLIDRIYASIAPRPADSTRQAREDYAVGLETIRDRLEACRTADDVTQVLGQLLEENTGVILNAAEQAEVEPLQSTKRALEKKIAELYREENELSTVHSQAIARVYVAKAEQAKRARRKWKPDPELDAELESAQTDHGAAKERLEAWRAAHPEIAQQKFEERQPNGGVRVWFRSELDLARQALQVKIRAVEEKARTRNIQENPMVRAWAQFGERFLNVLIYRRYKGSDAFAKHVARAKSGRITDWSWAEKGKISGKGAGKGAVRFQLQVASEFRREGGRVVDVNSTHALKARFNLRDVQSGNWVLKDPAAAKFHVEHTAQAFADLAGLLGVEESDVSFNGRLAMAFGARGQGSKGWRDNAARAHYEPIHRVINLTKMGGGGSLAHELFHAWDNIIREALGEGAVSAEYFATEMYQEIQDPAVREAFAGLERAMREGEHQFTQTHAYTESDYRLAKHNLDQGRSGFSAQIRDAGSLERALEVIASTFTRDDRRATKRKRDWTRIAVAWYGGNPEGGTIAAKTGPKMSTFEIEAMILDNGERDKYWSTRKEMAARAFQAWVEDRLRDRGQRNDYLSSGADNRWYPDANPYPEGAERERINAAFDVLMTTFRTQDVLKKAAAIFGGRFGRAA